MGIESVSLNTGSLSHHTNGGERWADAAVQIDGGFHNSSPRLCLLLGAPLEGVGPGHIIFIALSCVFNVDTPPNIRYTRMYYQI
jgi:hypothetical protein